jgi:hypothetical protein
MAAARIAAVLFAAFLSTLAAAQQQAQTPKGHLAIKVVDATAAVIPGAQISVVDPDSSRAETSITDSSGNASIALPVGRYEIRVSARGFKVHVQEIEVRDASYLQFTVTLSISNMGCGPCVAPNWDWLLIQLEPVDIGESIPLQPLLNLDPLPSHRPRRRW